MSQRILSVLFVLALAPFAPAANIIENGDFSDGLSGWSVWNARPTGGTLNVDASGGELLISGSDISGGVYQQFDTGGAGQVVNIIGAWRSAPAVANGMWAEVWVINGDRVPVDGQPETDGVNGAILLYRTDTFGGRGGWNGQIPLTAGVKHQAAFTAAADRATLILCTGNTGPSVNSGVAFDDLHVTSVAPPATLDTLPPGFARRSLTFPINGVAVMERHPIDRCIYAVQNGGNRQIYRIDPEAGTLTATLIGSLNNAGLEFSGGCQGMTFDPAGNMYVASHDGDIIKGIYNVPNGTFTWAPFLDLDESKVGGDHGVGGLAVGPDGKLYINSGSRLHGDVNQGLEGDTGLNARILRVNLDGSGLETFARGIRNHFHIAFRADGALFGVENGPDCAYADEFNRLEFGHHYGYPYRYASDLSGNDASVDPQCVFAPPGGLVMTGGWANYGPDGRPGPGQRGYQDGGAYYGFHPNSSPDGLTFYEPQRMRPGSILFPPAYRGRAFVARFGNSLNFPNVGHDVLSLQLDDAGNGFVCNTFLSGLGRAIKVIAADNGRLYVLEYNQQQVHNGPGGDLPSRLHEIAYTIPTDPAITVEPATLTRSANPGETTAFDTLTIRNAGVGTLAFTVSVDGSPDWISVSPASGTSTGADDPADITVNYNLSGQPLGTLSAMLRIVDPAAYNSPVLVPITIEVRTVRPDFDIDGDVDQSDFARLQICLSTAAGAPVPPACTPADLNADGTVGLADFNAFMACFAGPNQQPNPACDDTLP